MGRPSNARERLIEAAREVIYAQSYEAVSVDELCATAKVNKSSFYHFFASKQDLVLEALESQWQRFEELVLKPAFAADLPPSERILRFFDLTVAQQRAQKQRDGHIRGCPLGNLTLEMSTQNELIRLRVEQFFQVWLSYFERAIEDAKIQGNVSVELDTFVAAQALLAYFEGAVLLAKAQNDPTVIATLRTGALALMHYQPVSVS